MADWGRVWGTALAGRFERYAWATTAYLLASTAMIPVIGKLGDERGRATHAPKTVARPPATRGGTR